MIANKKVINIHFIFQNLEPFDCECESCNILKTLTEKIQSLYDLADDCKIEHTQLDMNDSENVVNQLSDIINDGIVPLFLYDMDEDTITVAEDIFMIEFEDNTKIVGQIHSDRILNTNCNSHDPMFG